MTGIYATIVTTKMAIVPAPHDFHAVFMPGATYRTLWSCASFFCAST